jgi:hypothetical protein
MDYSGTTAPMVVGSQALENKVAVLAERLNVTNMLKGCCFCPCLSHDNLIRSRPQDNLTAKYWPRGFLHAQPVPHISKGWKSTAGGLPCWLTCFLHWCTTLETRKIINNICVSFVWTVSTLEGMTMVHRNNNHQLITITYIKCKVVHAFTERSKQI